MSDPVGAGVVRHTDDVVDVTRAGGRNVEPPGPCLTNSFTGDTDVVMADGTRRDIASLTPGDVVLAADPVTGEVAPRQVTAAITGSGVKDVVDVTVRGDDGDGGTITATAGHPFWVENRQAWIDAARLDVGDVLVGADGEQALVAEVTARRALLRVHNLTVDGFHTFIVADGGIEALVHNCAGGRADSKALGRNLEAAGTTRPPESAAHHIVAGNAKDADDARKVLKEHGIDINDAANGVFLPKNSAAANPTGAAVHSKIHTRAYYDALNKVLSPVSSRDDVITGLASIRDQLLQGGFP